MLIQASQRGNGRELARHLMNGHDNEHVEVHEISGFIDETVMGAFVEIEAVAQGTKCVQPLFSVSFNPPIGEDVSTADFEDAIGRVEETMNLSGQPGAIVFHEKNRRRHAHAVWSRIDADEMKAINMPFFKNRMVEISKELYLEHGWELPKGYIDKELRNPLNFSLSEWQQARRLNDNPKAIKRALQESWSISDDKKSFESALEQHGFYLAKGDRRGFVAVDWRGEVYSLSRWLGVKRKNLQERLGEPEELSSVEDTVKNIDQRLKQQVQSFLDQMRRHHETKFNPLNHRKIEMTKRHKAERKALTEKLEKRLAEEQRQRAACIQKGVRGLWDRMTGKHAEIVKQNQFEAYQAHRRDQAEKDQLIFRQIDERQALQQNFHTVQMEYEADLTNVKDMLFSKNMPEEKIQTFEQTFNAHSQAHSMDFDMEM